jgi:hypothetical protein
MAALLAAPAANNHDEIMSSSTSSSSSSDSGDDYPPPNLSESIASLSESQRLGAAGLVDKALTQELYQERHKLFETLLDFFPSHLRQPKEDLKDLAAVRPEDVVKGRFD